MNNTTDEENRQIIADNADAPKVAVNTLVIRQYIVQQRVMENWYDLKPFWDSLPYAKEHLEECSFHMPEEIDFRIIERLIIETAI